MAPELHPSAQALLQRHLRSRWENWQALDHLATWAPSALLLGEGNRAKSRQEWGDDALLLAWAERPPKSTYRPSFDPEILLEFKPGQHLVAFKVAACKPEDAPMEVPSHLWLGLQEEAGVWAIQMSFLATDAPDSWADAQFLALSELSSLGAVGAWGPMACLADVAWARLSWLPRQPLMALAETRFACQGLGHCCEDTLTIGLDDEGASFLAQAPLAELMPDLGPGPYTEALSDVAGSLAGAKHKLLRRSDGRCRFLDDRRRCMLHAKAGRALFKPCHVFPFRFAWTPDGVAVTTLASCPTARAGIGPPLASIEKDLRARLQVADLIRPEGFWLGPAQEIPWAEWRMVEGQLLELLNQDAPLKARLATAMYWLAARTNNPDATVNAVWLQQPPRRLAFFKRWALNRYVKLFDRCFEDLHKLPKGQLRWEDAELQLTHFLRSLLFSKRFTYPYGLQGGLHAVALSYRLLERHAQVFGANRLSEAFWREAFGVLTIGTYPRLLQVVHRTPATGFANMLAQPGFGIGLLCL